MAVLTPGTEFGALRILRLLGSGGMADVYEAEDLRLGRRVALKVMPQEFARQADFATRFEREIRASAALSHIHIVTILECGQHGQTPYYTMRLLTGGDLRARIAAGLSIGEAVNVVRAMLQAFAHAHARGFVHRDVKPENILFDEAGTPVLADFGIAKVLHAESQITRTGMAVGTPRYISPEQAMGRPIDGRSDLYSLGCILYEMLTGAAPYRAETPVAMIFQHVSEPVPRLPPAAAVLQPLLNGLMAKDVDARLASAEAALTLLDTQFPPHRWRQGESAGKAAAYAASLAPTEVLPQLRPSLPSAHTELRASRPPPADPAPVGLTRGRLMLAIAGLGALLAAVLVLMPPRLPAQADAPSLPPAQTTAIPVAMTPTPTPTPTAVPAPTPTALPPPTPTTRPQPSPTRTRSTSPPQPTAAPTAPPMQVPVTPASEPAPAPAAQAAEEASRRRAAEAELRRALEAESAARVPTPTVDPELRALAEELRREEEAAAREAHERRLLEAILRREEAEAAAQQRLRLEAELRREEEEAARRTQSPTPP